MLDLADATTIACTEIFYDDQIFFIEIELEVGGNFQGALLSGGRNTVGCIAWYRSRRCC